MVSTPAGAKVLLSCHLFPASATPAFKELAATYAVHVSFFHPLTISCSSGILFCSVHRYAMAVAQLSESVHRLSWRACDAVLWVLDAHSVCFSVLLQAWAVC